MDNSNHPYLTWTVKQLRENLSANGIDVGSIKSRLTLRTLYKSNVLEKLSTTNSANGAMATQSTDDSIINSDCTTTDLTSTLKELKDLVATVATTLKSQSTTPSAATSQDSRPVDNVQRSVPGNSSIGSVYDFPGVASDTLPAIDMVSETIRKRILEFKDVDLACLLIPNYEPPKSTFEAVGTSIHINQEIDSKIKGALTIKDFVSAFSVYRRVMVKVHPERQAELEMYEYNMIDLYNSAGASFYAYHKAFSRKAAAAWTNHGIKVNWGIMDNKIVAGLVLGKMPCIECGAPPGSCIHSTGKASRTEQKPKPGARPFDKKGRPRVHHEGREICNNFNGNAGCFNPKCFYLHVCSKCFMDHSALQCGSGKQPVSSDKQTAGSQDTRRIVTTPPNKSAEKN